MSRFTFERRLLKISHFRTPREETFKTLIFPVKKKKTRFCNLVTLRYKYAIHALIYFYCKYLRGLVFYMHNISHK